MSIMTTLSAFPNHEENILRLVQQEIIGGAKMKGIELGLHP